MKTDDFDYVLPTDLIAQSPAERRELSRLMVLRRATKTIDHDCFGNLGAYLEEHDVLVANRSRVIPARLLARKETGGEVEILLLRRQENEMWHALARPSRRLRPDMRLTVNGEDLTAILRARLGDGLWLVDFIGDGDIQGKIRAAGKVPLPPYIKTLDGYNDRYQTVYADQDGSVAAPTAGLHFSHELLENLKRHGVIVKYVTLHVGLGTFRPVAVEDIEQHTMHPEWGHVPAATAQAINAARAGNGRVVSVGTTSTRLLESAFSEGQVHSFRGDTDRFIYPGYQFHAIDALITNFHLPKSTLLMLVSAFAGRDYVLEAYRQAVERKYRFFSFGDAMLIL